MTTSQKLSEKDKKEEQKVKPNLGLQKNQRILGQRIVDGFNNTQLQEGTQISKEASDDTRKNLDVQDSNIEIAKRTQLNGYGIRTGESAKIQYERSDYSTTSQALMQGQYDYIIPDFSRAKEISPQRCGLIEVPYVRYSPADAKMYSDKSIKALYVKNENHSIPKIGKEAIPYGQPIISHEFVEDRLFEIAEKNKSEFEIVPDLTRDDKRGYKRYWGILSKRLDHEIKDSFRIGDVVRIGALVRNGIAESTSVGFDLFTYCVTCQNGSVGRSKELGSESWKHIGDVEKLQEKIINGLNEIFEIGEELVNYYERANKIRMDNEMLKLIYEKAGISKKYYDESYFQLIPESEKSKKIKDVMLAKKDISLWQGFNALTAKVWHSDDLAFGDKAAKLRRLNDLLVTTVKKVNPS